jgi:hypothetical protein
MSFTTSSSFEEKRKFPRVEVRWPVTLVTEKRSFGGEARNISADGVFILFRNSIENLALNDNYLLLMYPANERLQLMAKPIWSNPDTPPGMGLCFVEISQGDRELLREAIEKHAGE